MSSEERIAVLKAGMAAFGLDDDFNTPELRATMSEIFESVASGGCHDSILNFGREAVQKQRAREQLRAERAAAPERPPAPPHKAAAPIPRPPVEVPGRGPGRCQ